MEVSWLVFFTYTLLGYRSGTLASSDDCAAKDYGQGSVVCVCDEKYCDTIEPLDESIPAGQYIQYVSNQQGLRLQKSTGKFQQVATKNAPIVIIDSGVTYQSILGWGGAFTDSTGINVKALSENVQEKWLNSYFADDGLEYSLCRIPIGGTDFSTRAYEYAEMKNDVNLTYFELSPEDYKYKIPLIKAANQISKREIKYVGSAWSAPAWMKTSDRIRGLGFLREEFYQVWANYHMKFLDEYRKLGVQFWGLTTGNEPVNGMVPVETFNAMGWTPWAVNKWIRENIGPTIKKSKFSHLKLLVLDDQRFFLPWWIHLMFSDKEATKYVDGIALHWYWDDLFPASVQTNTHESYPDKFLLNTEACVGDKFWEEDVILGSWERAEKYLKDIIDNINHWSVGWIDWNMALDEQGGPNWVQNYVDAPVIVNATANEFYKQPMFYAMGHCTKFVPPNSIRVKFTFEPHNSVKLMAFKRPDGKMTVVILNLSNENLTISIKDLKKIMNIKMTKHSIHTLIY